MKILQLVKAVFSSPLNLMTSNSFADVQDPRKRRRQAMSSSSLPAPAVYNRHSAVYRLPLRNPMPISRNPVPN